MRSLSLLLALVGTLSFTGAASAQEENTKEKYPQQLVQRPVILPKGMVEVILGAQLNFLADESTGQDAIRSVLDVQFGVANRLQMGLESDIQWAPSDTFEVRELALAAQYNVVPSTNIRVAGYMTIPRIGTELGDAFFGLQFGLPMKFRAGESLSVVASPRYIMDVSGDFKRKAVDLPIGVQVELVVQLAAYVSSGLGVVLNDFEADNAHIFMPVSAGFVFTPARLFDVGAEVRVDDLTDEAGRNSRWVTLWLGIRR